MRAIGKFNEHTSGDPKQLKIQSLREYFLMKISASKCVKQAAISLRALDVIVNESQFSFIKVVAGETQILGLESSITLQFFDMMGNPVGVKGRELTSAELYYFDEGSVDVSETSSLDANAGKVVIKLNNSENNYDLRHGAFQIQVTLKDAEN